MGGMVRPFGPLDVVIAAAANVGVLQGGGFSGHRLVYTTGSRRPDCAPASEVHSRITFSHIWAQ